MRIESTNLNFHSTFKPQMIYIAKILKLASENFVGDEKKISVKTGIPTGESTGKVLPHLNYAKFMGLIDFERKELGFELKRTKLGSIIGDEDPYLLENITRLILHYNITDIQKGAPHWAYLFKVFNYDLEEEYLCKNIEKAFQEYFGKSNLKINMLKSSYEEDCFELTRVAEISGSKGSEKIKFTLTYLRQDFINIYAYTLIKSMEQYYEEISEITVEQIVNDLKWNKPFGFDHETTLLVLDELQSIGYISINKQLNPITIIKLIDSDELISKIYEFAM